MILPAHRVSAFRRVVTGVNTLFARLSALVVASMLLMIGYEVVSRYVFSSPTVWAMDSSSYALTFAFFLALGPALQSGHHVDVDLFDPLIPARRRYIQQMAGALLTLVFAAVLLFYVSRIAWKAIQRDEIAFAMVVIRLKYVYWIGPVGALQFLLTALLLVFDHGPPAPPAVDERAA